MAKAKKLPSGNWRVQLFVGYDANGKRKYESYTAPTAAEANLLANTRKYELERGIKKERTPGDMTVGEAVDKYISDRDGILAQKTIREAKGYARNHFENIRNIRIKNLTQSMVQREFNRESKTLAPKTIKNIYSLFYASIRSAVPDISYKIILPRIEKKEIRIPTNEELMTILDHVAGKPLEIPVLLGATCGLRRSEIAALDLHNDVDYDNCRISVNKAITDNDESEWVVTRTKTFCSTRIIDCPPWVIDKLKEARDSGYENMNPALISTHFAKLCKKLNIKIRFHDLRHYYASLMLSLGVPDKYAMARMGHATPTMLKTVYQHLMVDKDREVTEQINGYFEQMQHKMQHESSSEDE